MNKSSLLSHGASINVPWGLLKLKGPDVAKLLQGQTTNDVIKLPQGKLSYNALVDQSGKLQSYFLIFKTASEFLLFIDLQLINETKERLEKYIITEDVEIEVELKPIILELGYESYAKAKALENCPNGFFWGVPGRLLYQGETTALKKLTHDEETFLAIESGIPRLGQELEIGRLINETFLEAMGISYSKGCFLGQETVSKIHHFRGPAYFPMKIISKEKLHLGAFFKEDRKIGEIKSGIFIQDEFIAYGYILRDYRLNQTSLQVTQNNHDTLIDLVAYPYKFNEEELSKEILELASNYFTHNDDSALAKKLLSVGIEINPKDGDLYESLGVLLGRENKFEEAIKLMDQLSLVDPDSVMAYTNKSLYLMKLGKIEEAEAAKATATIKSFSFYGKIAKEKEEKERREKLAMEQLEKRRGMFQQVLEIDPDDALANFGLGEINFESKNFPAAIESLKKVITVDPKYSVAYLVLGKTFEALGEWVEAQNIYKTGIPIATAKGEMMPANEMQSRLSKIKI